ncbi:MAG: tetratricopeptide repeat protein [Oligoflexales bacterium]|nr:tetratricopeptide repeat protein [Oligoflexales bacterium]
MKIDRYPAKYLSVILILILTIFMLTENKAESAEFGPILPLKSGNLQLPMLDIALRDPSFERAYPTDDMYADQLRAQISEMNTDLSASKKLRKLELQESLYQSYAKLSYYLYDLSINGQISKSRNIKGELSDARTNAINFAMAFAKDTKSTEKKAKALYTVLTFKYLEDSDRDGVVASAGKLGKGLNQGLSKRLKFLVALQNADGRGKSSISDLNSGAGSLSKNGTIVGHLALARAYAGINSRGERAGAKNGAYASHLRSAAHIAEGLSQEQKNKVFEFSLAVWQRAEGVNIDWTKAPFNYNKLADADTAMAILERSALYNYKKGKTDNAIKIYEKLSLAYRGNPAMLNLDRRIEELERAKFAKSKNVDSYVRVLVAMADKYEDTTILGNNSEGVAKKAAEEFKAKHRILVFGLLEKATGKGESSASRMKAIAVANGYLEKCQNVDEKKKIALFSANIYSLDRKYANAVAIYDQLIASQNSSDKEKITYVTLAIEAQSYLAAWPKDAPWTKMDKKNMPARAKLADLYMDLYKRKGQKADWNLLAHLGLLKINIGQVPEAFGLWTKALSSEFKNPHAFRASGMMLATYDQSGKWEQLESLSRFCIEKGVTPINGNKNLDPHFFLANALFNGGKELYENKKYAVAVKKLKEFVDKYRTDKRRDNGIYLLAASYRGNGQHKESLEALAVIVKSYPKSPFYPKALLNGGDWATEIASEDYIVYFHQKFLNEFRNDSSYHRVKEGLLSLYMGREIYGPAADIHKVTMRDSKESKPERVKAAVRYMDIEYRYGDKDDAIKAANTVLGLSDTGDAAKADALGMLAKLDVKENDVSKLEGIEKRIEKLDTSSKAVMENLAMVRFMIAEAKAEPARQEIFNLELTDPIATIKQQFAAFSAVSKEYSSVCAAGSTSYCAPAMYRLAILTAGTIKVIEPITIQESLSDATVEKFTSEKQKIITSLTETAANANKTAIKLVKEGSTTPNWAQQILWSNSKDWDFQRISNESKGSFVEWKPVSLSGKQDNE